jgi:hypothetical protein
MIGAHRAIIATTRPPITATITMLGLRWRCVNDGSDQPTRWKNARFVSSAIRCTST